MKRVYFIATGIFICLSLFYGNINIKNFNQVYAKNSIVRYSYDSLGRVSSAVYPDGTKIIYEYDKNGNLKSCRKEETTTEQSTTEKKTEEKPEEKTEETTEEIKFRRRNINYYYVEPKVVILEYDIRIDNPAIYNAFKKRSPVIKSLKQSKSKNKYYLNIKIRRIKNLKNLVEEGYQIKYATNSTFKKAKTLKVSRNKKNVLTGKKWKIKKGKTYYVKVRAYVKNPKGRVIYSKYCKYKKIKIKK